MTINSEAIQLGSFMSVTLGIVILFAGKRLNDQLAGLRRFSIPDSVTGGLLFSILVALLYGTTGLELTFETKARDILLVYFFTTIGINASLRDLLAGGKPLLVLLAVTIAYMFLQNLTGLTIATLFDLPRPVGILGGTISLIGGHGTAIAWAPRIVEDHGIANAAEIGIACATFGLVLASLMGGPIARYLIQRHRLEPQGKEISDVGFNDQQPNAGIGHLDFLDALLAIHVCVILGGLLHAAFGLLNVSLPLFVYCLFAGILMTNIRPQDKRRLTGTRWPTRTPAMALIADLSLGTFLAMSLMSLQLWTLVDLAGPILSLLGAQFLIAVIIAVRVVFPLMGRTYDAAVICAGFGGIALGSTPTAMANMASVTNKYGGSHLAFIVVPLVCAFFIDLANALIIPYFLSL